MNALTFKDFANCVNDPGSQLKAEDDIQIDGDALRKAKFTAGKFRRAFCWSKGARDACQANNDVRSALVNAVMRECNVTNFWRLPPKVLEAFKGRFAAFSDSDLMLRPDRDNPNVLRATNGRPLSVRRIRAIVEAVNASKGTGAVRTDRPAEPERVQVGPQKNDDERILSSIGSTLAKFRPIFDEVNVPAELKDQVWGQCIQLIKSGAKREPNIYSKEGDRWLRGKVTSALKIVRRELLEKNGPNLDWGTEINRFGGIFAQGSKNRDIGISLMKNFHKWFREFFISEKGPARDLLANEMENGFRFFMFRELALRESVEEDPDRMFGEAALTVLARKGLLQNAPVAVLMSMPPEKRQLVFAAAAVLPGPIMEYTNRRIMFSRIVRHLDDVEGLVKNDNLTAKSLFETVFSDCEENIPEEPTAKDFEDRLSSLQNSVREKYPAGETVLECRRYEKACDLMLSGRNLEEIDCAMDGKSIKPNVYPVEIQLVLSDFYEDDNPGKILLAKDICRPMAVNEKCKRAYTFQFPNRTIVSEYDTNATDKQEKELASQVAEEVVKLCGSDRLGQISIVEAHMSQNGFAAEIGRQVSQGYQVRQGYTGGEHIALTFRLSKNDETGDVRIDYSEPEGCEVSISAFVIVHPNGGFEKSKVTVKKKS